MYGVPVLAFCMMANNTIRAEDKPKRNVCDAFANI